MSGCSDDAASGEAPAVGTHFTRDFYRLVKFESTKSLASTSSRSLVAADATPAQAAAAAGAAPSAASLGSLGPRGPLRGPGLPPERELALQSVLSFIAEQQQYCASREQSYFPVAQGICRADGDEEDARSDEARDGDGSSRPSSSPGEDASPADATAAASDADAGADAKIEREPSDVIAAIDTGVTTFGEEQRLSEEHPEAPAPPASPPPSPPPPPGENEARPAAPAAATNRKRERLAEALRNEHNIRLIQELKDGGCLASQPMEEHADKMVKDLPTEHRTVTDSSTKAGPAINHVMDGKDSTTALFNGSGFEIECLSMRPRRTKEDELKERLGRHSTTEVLVTVFEEEHEDEVDAGICRSMTESFTSTVSSPDTVVCPSTGDSVPANGTGRRVPQSQCTQVSPDATLSPFHERTSSKDVIDELNRMIRKGEDSVSANSGHEGEISTSRLDVACCCPTGWVHVERDIDFTDPKARANLLDVMLASSGSSGNSSGSSSGGGSSSSSSSESGEEPADYQHLHRLHRFRRQKKASATREQLGVLRYPGSSPRPSILGRDDFYVRYGDKEREAVASFDFLEDLSTTSVSGASSCDTLGSHNRPPLTPATAPSSAQPSAGTTPSSSEDCNLRSPGFNPLMDSASDNSKHFFSPSIESGEV